MSDDVDVRQKMFSDLKDVLYKRQLSNSESFDKSILSLSSAGLAISITFIKNIVPLDKANGISYLEWSWFLFGAAIVSTILSLMSSQLGMSRQLAIARHYYLENKDEALSKSNIFSTITDYLNWMSGLAFISAIGLIVVFATLNI